jgi:hypothetical protein
LKKKLKHVEIYLLAKTPALIAYWVLSLSLSKLQKSLAFMQDLHESGEAWTGQILL